MRFAKKSRFMSCLSDTVGWMQKAGYANRLSVCSWPCNDELIGAAGLRESGLGIFFYWILVVRTYVVSFATREILHRLTHRSTLFVCAPLASLPCCWELCRLLGRPIRIQWSASRRRKGWGLGLNNLPTFYLGVHKSTTASVLALLCDLLHSLPLLTRADETIDQQDPHLLAGRLTWWNRDKRKRWQTRRWLSACSPAHRTDDASRRYHVTGASQETIPPRGRRERTSDGRLL
ncbi:hypothetical protein T440DRAFT_124942 [Plenodomus tracheiphilus IPT5]|uniref:Uncharacterized protein n=1 Tax=Plenodomus tracheiphilus IPT5 TaxID=1408161 RepID=A0A6A7B2J2_9PLEO|nr:hypothetical protein T440DRAFT_124942 [Plenodomus tracheiphilus IPT5]